MSRRRHRGARSVIAFSAIAVAGVSLVPVGYLFLTGISLQDIRKQFRYPATGAALLQTIELTVLISVLTVVLGVGCALLVARTTLPFPRLFTVLFALPLAVPGFVSAYADYSTELTYAPKLGVVTSFGGASLIMALTLYPYVFLPCVVALRTVDPALEEVVASLRPRRVSVLWRVILPALRPAIAAGVLIVALHVLAEYGGMVQLERSTLTTKIMAEMLDYGDYRSARSLSVLLMVLSIAVLLATRLLTGPSRLNYVTHGSTRPPQRASLGRLRIPTIAVGLAVPLAAIGPTALMTLRGLTNSDRKVSVDWSTVGRASSTTLGYAVAAALVATAVALPVSWWVNRRPSFASNLTERTVWVAHAIPSAILALALVYLAIRLVPALYKTSTVLIAAYVILFLPLAVAYQRVGLGATRRSYDEIAASLGARPGRTFFRITLPLALPGFIAGALLVGLDVSKELTTTLILIPYNAKTLSTQLWATTNGESLDFTAAAPYAAMLVLLGIPPVYLLVRHVLRQVDVAPDAITPSRADKRPRAVQPPLQTADF
ncbi:MAG: iron ABC transporter permease [Jatrophihabitantaceae bacterium]